VTFNDPERRNALGLAGKDQFVRRRVADGRAAPADDGVREPPPEDL
jgi:hypothetical protein